MIINYQIQKGEKRDTQSYFGKLSYMDRDFPSQEAHEKIITRILDLHPGWRIVGYAKAPKE